MAEREGFEPPIGLHLCRISSAVHSTTLPPLHIAGNEPVALRGPLVSLPLVIPDGFFERFG